ncbi:MAG: Dps family protein [Flexibacteraceae bacterium]
MAYSETAIHKITEVLSKTLANTYLLALKTKNFHWNVKGPNFHSLHLLFDEQNGALVATADEVAERIRAFNKPAIGTMTEFLKAATLKESPANYPDAPTMIAALVADHEHIIEALLVDIEVLTGLSDVGSADMLTGQLQEHEKMAWMLRSHLQ